MNIFHNFSKVTFALTFSLIFIINALLVSGADAKTSPAIRQVGFDSYRQLPLNAKGVLFKSTDYLENRHWSGLFIGNGKLVKNLPPNISNEAFSISDNESGAMLQAEIITDQPLGHFYRIVDKVLSDCIYESGANRHNSVCQSKDVMNIRDEATFRRLLKQGKVQDVSAAFFYGLRSAWIRPKSGFKEGHTYIFNYHGLEPHEPFFSQTRTLSLLIGPVVDAKLFDRIRLVDDGDVTFDEIYTDRGRDSFLSSYRSMVRNIRFDLPPELEKYRETLVYSAGSDLSDKTFQDVLDSIHSRPCVACHWPPIAPVRGSSFIELLSKCSARKNGEPLIEFWGHVQFPELGDDKYSTPKLALKFQNENGKFCYGWDFFDRVTKNREPIEIRKLVCDLAEGPVRDVNVTQYLPALRLLLQGNDDRTKVCSENALRKLSDFKE